MAARWTLDDLLRLMRTLRDPERGCPWDLEQDFASIAPHTLEEAYELVDAINHRDWDQLRDELGDVLFQVIFYSRLGEEQGLFGFEEVLDNLVEKLLRRHPHVFPDGRLDGAAPDTAVDTQKVAERWETIKGQERRARSQHSELDDVPLALPALSRARKLQKRASRVGFDWDDSTGVLEKCEEELAELRDALKKGVADEVAEEAGDLLFTVVNLCRKLNLDAEQVLRASNHKFQRRFQHMEASLREQGRKPQQCSAQTWESLWSEAKRRS